MRHFKEITTKEKILDYTQCDKCKTKIDSHSLDGEIINISHTFGYGSSMDMTNISFDICEKCFLEMIKGIDYKTEEKGAWSV